MLDIIELVSKELNIDKKKVENTIKLLDEGGTVPFISRYRKEITGNLNEEEIRDINDRINYLRNLESRKEEVIKLIDEQGQLTEDLKKKILNAKKLQKVEDLYLPYKKKKKTKADIAKDNGLEGLSIYMFLGNTSLDSLNKEAEKYINENVETIELAIDGAKLIIAQNISETIEYREMIRTEMLKNAAISSKLIAKNKAKDENQVYQDYYEYSEDIKKVASHRVLALNRGEKEKILKVTIEIKELALDFVKRRILKDFRNVNLKKIYEDVLNDSLSRLILPSIEREVRNILSEMAEEEAIRIFQKNLHNLIMQPPIEGKNLLGLDPGYRTGCKTVVVNNRGFHEVSDVLYLIHGDRKIAEAKEKLKKLIVDYDIDIIAIGNGTASRETEQFVAEILKEMTLKKKVFYIIVNEAGASIYSASKLAKEEFPDLDVTERGAISIAKRVQDPLAELVKIDPQSIGVGMYQHDLNQKKLGETLDETVESVVNNVGVNVNTASWALLNYVSGVKKNIAKNIVDYRNENGDFKTRSELKKVKGLGAKAFTLAAGFIVVPESKNPLDNTIVHPESYKIAEEILKENGFKLKELNDKTEEVVEALKSFDINKFVEEKEYGKETTEDIYKALIKKRRDPRESYPQPILKSDILSIDDLKDGMELEGTVRNVVKFGAFVDIGLKNDAMLHISEFGKVFVKDPMDHVAVGDIVKVKIKSVDKKRQRVALTMKESIR